MKQKINWLQRRELQLHLIFPAKIGLDRRRLKLHLIPFFKDASISKISSFDIERYKKSRLEENAAVGTINRELAALSHLFSKSIEWQWLDKKPAQIRRYREEQKRITYLTVEQIDRLIESSKQDQNPQIYLFIVIGLGTAMRRMEILSIKLENIDLGRRVIYIPQAKAGAREQPITAYLADFLRGHLETARPGQIWLFPSKHSSNGYTNNIEKAFRRTVIP